jgi:RimJ/RimL family protein N-acetyltransferase
MIVRQYGVTYQRLRPEHLEILRYWRNQEYIRNTMQFKDYITPAMQLKWFEKINNKFNYYFIIEHEGKKVGLINCKDTEPDSRVAEGGIFIWEKNYWGTPIPAFASLTLLQAVFEIFKTGEASVATVACDNKRALEFNFMLGYEIKDKTPDGNYYKLYLSKEKYMSHCKKLIRAAAILHKDGSEFNMEAEPADNLVDEVNDYLRHRPA